MRFAVAVFSAFILIGLPALAAERQDFETCRQSEEADAIADFREAIRLDPTGSSITSQQELESLGAGEPKTEPEAPKRGVLDLLK